MLPSQRFNLYREPPTPDEQEKIDQQLKARSEAKEAEKRLTDALTHVQYAERLTRKALDKLGEALDSSVSTNQHWATEMVLKHLYKVPGARQSAQRTPQAPTDNTNHDHDRPTHDGHIYIRGLRSDLL